MKRVLAIAGVLILLYVCYGVSQAPRRAKVRAQRIQAMNAAPSMVLRQTGAGVDRLPPNSSN